jgi:hypothetical protein
MLPVSCTEYSKKQAIYIYIYMIYHSLMSWHVSSQSGSSSCKINSHISAHVTYWDYTRVVHEPIFLKQSSVVFLRCSPSCEHHIFMCHWDFVQASHAHESRMSRTAHQAAVQSCQRSCLVSSVARAQEGAYTEDIKERGSKMAHSFFRSVIKKIISPFYVFHNTKGRKRLYDDQNYAKPHCVCSV